MNTIIVTDDPLSWAFLKTWASVIQASDYLSHQDFLEKRAFRVINLCRSYAYQTIGYYVSLLAQARDHRAIPSVAHIQDVLNVSLSKQISCDIEQEIQHSLKDIKTKEFVLSVYFGQNMAKCHAVLAKKLHSLFPLPLIRVTFKKNKHWSIQDLSVLSAEEVPTTHRSFMEASAERYLTKKRFHQWRKKQRYHDLAILIDPHEPNAPSNQKALDYFIDAGESIGLNVELIDKNHAKSLAEYDALFIRATTAVDHYTYRFARRGIQDNLVVIDDPQSIVKCTNKVYLAELMRSHHLLTPETRFISKYDTELPTIHFPCVLKKPDSAFSHGVIKVHDMKSFMKALTQFFKTSDLILLQPFIPTEFDWRIGVIDHKPLFACRYYMAKDHWQIYNWDATHEISGDSETVPLDAVPESILKTALKATRLIGDGLYGVDIKSHENKHYVIEINDNPNVDADIEDRISGEALYHDIMSVFLTRIRRKHGYV